MKIYDSRRPVVENIHIVFGRQGDHLSFTPTQKHFMIVGSSADSQYEHHVGEIEKLLAALYKLKECFDGASWAFDERLQIVYGFLGEWVGFEPTSKGGLIGIYSKDGFRHFYLEPSDITNMIRGLHLLVVEIAT